MSYLSYDAVLKVLVDLWSQLRYIPSDKSEDKTGILQIPK